MPRIIVTLGDMPVAHDVPEGSTLQEYMLDRYPESRNFPVPVIAWAKENGEDLPLMRAEWPVRQLYGDEAICVTAVALGGGGGGSSTGGILQIIISVVAAVASVIFPVAAPFIMAAAVAANMLVGAIFKPKGISAGHLPAASAEAASPTYSINASSNQARLNQPEPEGFGRLSVIPDYVAVPWSEYVGNEQYLYQVFGLGRGLYEIHSMAFGGTEFWKDGALVEGGYVTYDDDGNPSIQIQIVDPGGAVTLFPDNVESSVSVAGQELIAPNADGHGWVGPFPVCPPGTTTTRIQNDLVFQRGLGRYNDKGKLRAFTVEWEFQYQQIDDWNTPQTTWATLNKDGRSLGTQTPQRISLLDNVIDGRYWVRARRSSNTVGDGRTLDEMRWEGMRAYLPGTLRYHQTVVALRIKATNTMSQNAAERFTVIQTRKLPVWNPQTRLWSEPEPTRSFAAAVAWVAKCEWGGRLTDNRIDLAGLAALEEKITARGWTFDAWIDGPYSVWSLITEMCAAVRVIPRPAGSILTFVMDEADRPVRHVFTPHDIVRGSFRPRWITHSDSTPDDVIVSYLDEDAGYAKREVQITLPGSKSREPKQVQPIGIVKSTQAHDYGEHLTACNHYRRLGLDFQIEGLGRLLNLGDVVAVEHPRLRRCASGTIKDWNDTALILELNSVPVFDGNDPYLLLADPYGRPWGPVRLQALGNGYARFDAEDYDSLLGQGLESPFTWMTRGYDRKPTVWTLLSGRTIRGRYLVERISQADGNRHSLSLINDDPRVYNTNIPMQPWGYRTNAITSSVAAPTYLHVSLNTNDGMTEISWVTVPGALSYDLEYSLDGTAWVSLGGASINRVVAELEPGLLYVRVAAVGSAGRSPWAQWKGDTSLEPPEVPQPVLAEPFTGARLALAWPKVADAESYSIRISPTPEVTAPIRIQQVAALAWVYTPTMARDDGGPWRTLYVGIAAVNSAGASAFTTLTVSDTAPAIISPEDIQSTVTAASVTLQAVAGTDADSTGYVLARGANAAFLLDAVMEMRIITSLPYTWENLAPATTYYFRIAAKDAFFDAAADYADLQFSAVFTVQTGAE